MQTTKTIDGGTTPIIIVGAGPAGTTLARLLAEAGVAPILVDAGVAASDRGGTNAIHVGECLPPNLNPLLHHLRLYDQVAGKAGETGHLACHGQRSIWGGPVLVQEDYIAGRHGAGWHLDRARFDDMLLNLAMAAGVDYRPNRRVISAETGSDGTILTFDNGKSLTARLVIDASGRSARLARSLGAVRLGEDPLLGTVGFLSASDRIQDSWTMVEAAAAGWWYSALLPSGGMTVAFMTDAADAPRDLPSWRSSLAKAPQTLARVNAHGGSIVGPLWRRPAGMARLDYCVGPGWLAIGDAAASYDPISSHGIGSALGSAAEAFATIMADRAGDKHAFARYASRMDAAWQRCLDGWQVCYAVEQRWPDQPFWHRRHQGWQAVA